MYIKTRGIQSLMKYWCAREGQPTLKIDMPLLYKRTRLSLATCHKKYREYAHCSCEERMLMIESLRLPYFILTADVKVTLLLAVTCLYKLELYELRLAFTAGGNTLFQAEIGGAL